MTMATRKEWPSDRIQQAFAVLQSRSIMQDELLQLKATALQLGSTEGSKLSNTLLVLSDPPVLQGPVLRTPTSNQAPASRMDDVRKSYGSVSSLLKLEWS